MKQKLIEHMVSIILISAILIGLLLLVYGGKQSQRLQASKEIETYLNLPFVNFDRAFDKALLLDILNIYEPEEHSKHETLLNQIDQFRRADLLKNIETAYLREQLTWQKFMQILLMYLKFILIYAVVMISTFYGVETFGVIRFIRMQQKKTADLHQFLSLLLQPFRFRTWRSSIFNYLRAMRYLLQALLKAIIYLILFSPAYVIAYSLKTEFNTNSFLFMIILGVISNGLLITYTNKFYTFLRTESRKGYVQTAIVKNLDNSYQQSPDSVLSYKNILKIKKDFKDHVFQHIFMNARFQYLATIKEQASFLITGLIIIEMALNIQGHLTYEMLKQILYKNFDIVMVIILGIFYVLKCTEIITDYLIHKETMKYENL